MSNDRTEYQQALEENYQKLSDSLNSLVGENMEKTKVHNGNSLHRVTGAQVDSSTA